MKTLLSLALSAVLFAGCQSSSNSAEEQSGSEETPPAPSAKGTYAELSRKTGGTWKDRKYEGGTFENVDSLRVPDQNTDHSFFMRYEGPGWESGKIGYRLYLDWRNATDIFGKKTDSMVLSHVGQDNYDSYHEPGDWGQDILKVGSALGIGSVGRLVDGKVRHFEEVDSTLASVHNGDARSSVTVNYYGWKTGDKKIDLTSVYSIAPDTRYTRHEVTVSAPVEGLSTGIVIHDSTEVLTNTSADGKWAYLATYGIQTLVPDKLGMAILYKTDGVNKVEDREFDHLIEFKPTGDKIVFYFLGAWEQEPGGIKTQDEFRSYLDGLLTTLNDQGTL